MKKIISLALCFILCFRLCAVPAHAAAVEPEPLMVDEPVMYTIAPASFVGGASAMLASAGGAIAVAAPLLPIIGCIVGVGVIGYSAYQIVYLANELFFLLPQATQLLLYEWGERWAAGEETDFEFDGETAAAMQSAMQAVFFADDGTFASMTGLTFDSSNLLAYNSDYFAYNENYDKSVYQFDLSFDSATVLGDMGLTAQLVANPFAGANYGLRIYNIATGVSVIYEISSRLDELLADALSYKISVPCIETRTSDAGTFFDISFFILGHMSNSWATPVDSFRVHDAGSRVVVDGLQNYKYNGDTVGISSHSSGTTWAHDNEVFEDPITPGMYALGTTHATIVEPDEILKLEEGTTVQTLTDGETLEDYTDRVIDGASSDTDTEAGFFDKVLDIIKEILIKITAVLEFVLTIIETLVGALTNLALSLFIPAEGFWEAFIADIMALFDGRLGILTYPFAVVADFLNHLLDIGSQEPVLRWNAVSVMGYEFIHAGSFNFNDLLEEEAFKKIHDVYLLVVDAGIVFGLVALLRRKYDSVIAH